MNENNKYKKNIKNEKFIIPRDRSQFYTHN